MWGQRRLRYLQEHRPILYANLKTSGQLRSHLADVEEQANALFLRLVKDYAASEGVTEQLKAEDPMEWVRRMNGIRARVQEIVSSAVILNWGPLKTHNFEKNKEEKLRFFKGFS